MTDQFWKMKSPMGFSALQLDKDLYKELIKESAYKGLRVDNLPIQVNCEAESNKLTYMGKIVLSWIMKYLLSLVDKIVCEVDRK